MIDQCAFEVYPGSRYRDPEPPERCGDDADEGSEFCTVHRYLGED